MQTNYRIICFNNEISKEILLIPDNFTLNYNKQNYILCNDVVYFH